MDEYVKQFWDDRHWQLSLKTDNPVETYKKIQDDRESLEQGTDVEELPEHEKAWLRATS